jgi:hypothetical protein
MIPKDINPNGIKPTVINVIPKPLKSSGTSLCLIYLRTPFRYVIARFNQHESQSQRLSFN